MNNAPNGRPDYSEYDRLQAERLSAQRELDAARGASREAEEREREAAKRLDNANGAIWDFIARDKQPAEQ